MNPILKWLFPAPKLKPRDAVIGAIGALIAIGVTYWVSDQLIDIEKSPILALAMGASAISAVIGSSEILDLGYEYVWRPVLLNAVLLVVLAIVLNAPFADRRYPLPVAKTA